MSGTRSAELRNAASLAIGAAIATLALAGSATAADAIFKCRDDGGHLMYTDSPCRGGEKLELKVEPADPLAIERLASAQKAASERAAEQRAAAAVAAAMSAQRAVESRPPEVAPSEQATSCDYCGGWPVYAPPPRHKARQSRHPPKRAAAPMVRTR